MNFVNEIILLNPQEKAFFRKLEKVQTKIIKCKYSIIFNKTCLKENIFPRYSNNYKPKCLNELKFVVESSKP